MAVISIVVLRLFFDKIFPFSYNEVKRRGITYGIQKYQEPT